MKCNNAFYRQFYKYPSVVKSTLNFAKLLFVYDNRRRPRTIEYFVNAVNNNDNK